MMWSSSLRLRPVARTDNGVFSIAVRPGSVPAMSSALWLASDVERELVGAARHRRVGRQQRARGGERRSAREAGAGEAQARPDARVGRAQGLELQVRDELQLAVDIAQHRAGERRAVDARHLERLALGVRVAERPGVVVVRPVPFEVDRAVGEQQVANVPLAEDQRQGRDAAVDAVGMEELRPRRPGGVGDRQPLGHEVNLERIEIELGNRPAPAPAGAAHCRPAARTDAGGSGLW